MGNREYVELRGATRGEYLRGVLQGRIVCYGREELAEAAGVFEGELRVGAGLWVNGWPVELEEYVGAGEKAYGQVWWVRTMFVADRSYEMEIGPGDEVREVGK